jgi:hypothetical protein
MGAAAAAARSLGRAGCRHPSASRALALTPASMERSALSTDRRLRAVPNVR